MRSVLEDDTCTDAKIIIYAAACPDGIVVHLNCADLKMVTQTEIKASTENTREVVIGEGFVNDWASNSRRTLNVADLRSYVTESDHCVSERLEDAALGIVLYLDAADDVCE